MYGSVIILRSFAAPDNNAKPHMLSFVNPYNTLNHEGQTSGPLKEQWYSHPTPESSITITKRNRQKKDKHPKPLNQQAETLVNPK